MLVVPKPESITQTDGTFGLTSRTRIEYADLFSPDAFRIACRLRDELRDRHGLAVPVAKGAGRGRGAVLVGTLDDAAVADALKGCGLRARARSIKREGYLLHVAADRAVIAGFDAAGLFYGVQTFLQLAERQGRSVHVPCGRYVDQPAHPFRGVHLYVPPKTEIAYFKRLIRYLASCKINTVILEIAAGLEYKRHPEFNRAWEVYTEKARRYPYSPAALTAYKVLHTRGSDSNHFEQGGGTCITQDDMRDILRCARQNHVEMVPEIQSPGHAYWLCLAHPEVAEWQEAAFPDTMCPSNPRSYELLFDAMDEVIELFEPRWMNTGNDEYYFYGICPRCKERKGGDILADHLNKVNAFLRDRGVKHLCWADKLINPDEMKVKRLPEWGTGDMIKYGGGRRVMDDAEGAYVMKETWQAVDKIPDDVLMMDWYYSLSPDTEQYFGRHGKEVVYGNFSPSYFAKHPQRLRGPNVHGGEISTWIENGQMSHAHNNFPLQAAFTADLLWSRAGRAASLDMRALMAFWRKQRDMLLSDDGRLPTRKPGKLAYRQVDMGVPAASGDERVPRVKTAASGYHVPFRTSTRPLVLRPGDRQGHRIAVGRKLRSILFLHGVTVKQEDVQLPPLYDYGDYGEYYLSREVGAFTMRAGFEVKHPRQPMREGRVPIRLGFEIGSLCEPMGVSAVSRPTFCDAIPQPDGTAVFAYEWVNPNPGLVIEDLTLMRGRAEIPGDLIVYAMTLVL